MVEIKFSLTDNTAHQVKSIFGDIYNKKDINELGKVMILVALAEELQEQADNAIQELNNQ